MMGVFDRRTNDAEQVNKFQTRTWCKDAKNVRYSAGYTENDSVHIIQYLNITYLYIYCIIYICISEFGREQEHMKKKKRN